ncbi:MAG: T9SS type A sorting domain-containing protein [Putridiphycobacter sp.]
MKKVVFIFGVLLTFSWSHSQVSFQEVLPQNPTPKNLFDFEGVRSGDISYADVDSDMDIDVFITGQKSPDSNSDIPSSTLYLNDGDGNFTLDGTNQFEDLEFSSSVFGDVESDGDVDLLVSGRKTNGDKYTKLYLNDGSGHFTISINSFVNVNNGTVDFIDYDGDSDLDIFITGMGSNAVATLYINDGLGNYSESFFTNFTGVYQSAFDYSDVDLDGDIDFVISGLNSSGNSSTNLYLNNGDGTFVLSTGLNLPHTYLGVNVFEDVDSDGDEDLLISGYQTGSVGLIKLFVNDGVGNFTEQNSFSSLTMGFTLAGFEDLDNDGDKDLIFSGKVGAAFATPGQAVSKYYLNDGSGIFVEVSDHPFEKVMEGSIAIFDADLDNNLDVVICGVTAYYSQEVTCKFYSNRGNGNFLEAYNGVFCNITSQGKINFSDVNGDGFQDVLIFGVEDGTKLSTKLFINDVNGNFVEKRGNPFVDIRSGSSSFADVNNDGFIDILLSGSDFSNSPVTELYLGDGNGNFSIDNNSSFYQLRFSGTDFSDIDNDGDLDLLLTGSNSSDFNNSYLYLNNGSGVFSLMSGTSLAGASSGFSKFVDIDSDGDSDIIIYGNANFFTSSKVGNLYKNDGSGNFTYFSSGLPKLGYSAGDFADVDNDGDLDLIVMGSNSSSVPQTTLFLNDGNGIFSSSTNNVFQVGTGQGIEKGAVKFTDFDNDGISDIAIMNFNGTTNSPQTGFYLNDGNGNFMEIQMDNVVDIYTGDICFEDVDGDQKNDFICLGKPASVGNQTKLYKNTSCFWAVYQTDSLVVCDSLLWIDGNTYTSSTNTPTYTFQGGAVNGCDSIVHLDLTVLGNSYSQNAFFQVCLGDSFTFPDGSILNNIMSDTIQTSNLTSVVSGCDSIIFTTIELIPIDTTISKYEVNVISGEPFGDSYNLIKCNTNQIWSNVPYIVTNVLPGNYAFEIFKNGCIDTSSCIEITNQDYYNLQNYSPLSAEVFAFPVSVIDTCDAMALASVSGGFQPYHYSWFTQANNENSELIDSLCEGFHTLKITDLIGDTTLVDYYVTDSINWFNWYDSLMNYVDTVYLAEENCNLDLSIPIDSGFISNIVYLFSDTNLNENYYFLEINYYQDGNSFFYGDTVIIEGNGQILVDFSIYCPMKSMSRIKTIITTFDFPDILDVNNVLWEEPSIYLYPNPSNGDFTLYVGNSKNNYDILIYDLMGKVVLSKEDMKTSKTHLTLKEFESGIYFVQVKIGLESVTLKFVKN